ncbi:MAG: GIY-YIG nuclease family protein, partial [Pseudomonadota bacterium]
MRRAWQHKHGFFEGFSKQHGCHSLVWYEIHDDISEAIYKEKQMKKWKRLWKLELIEKANPDWRD